MLIKRNQLLNESSTIIIVATILKNFTILL